MTRTGQRRSPTRLAVALLLSAGCFGGSSDDGSTPPGGSASAAAESDFRSAYDATPIDLRGAVVDTRGRAIVGAQVTLADRSTATDGAGAFALTGLTRANALLAVEADGHHAVHVAVRLTLPIDVASTSVGTLVAVPFGAGSTRFLFGGDVSLGRRFLDPGEFTPRGQVPPDDPQALILVSDPEPGSLGAVRYVRPLFQAADYPIVNLETPVTDNPATPHLIKDFVFFTLPGSLSAFGPSGLGVPYVTIGNNHLFDYLQPGIADTRRFLGEARIAFSGAGVDAAEAAEPYRTSIGGVPYSMLAATSITGRRFEIDFVASDTKGGAANLDSDELAVQIADELDAGRSPILQLHTGLEYTFTPGEFAGRKMRAVADAGAALVIAHHPHVAQGFERHAGVLMAHSLGNFVFDQERLETMLGLLAQIDLRGRSVRFARAVPIYLEDFRPRPVTAPLAERFLRRIGEVSRPGNVLVYPHAARGWISLDPRDSVVRGRATTIDVTIPEAGWTVVDLREHAAPDESLLGAAVHAPGLRARIGRDLLLFGDFEDVDVDDERFEIARWDTSGSSRFPCLRAPYRGAVALCLVRDASHREDTVAALRNRVRVRGDVEHLPQKDLTLVAYARGENAGALTVVARYQASEGDATFGEETAFRLEAGSYGWTRLERDPSMPPDDPATLEDREANPRALRLFVRHSPPVNGEGLASVDELAIVSWEEQIDLTGSDLLETPHARDFLRLEGPPGSHRLELRLRTYRPAAATGS